MVRTWLKQRKDSKDYIPNWGASMILSFIFVMAFTIMMAAYYKQH